MHFFTETFNAGTRSIVRNKALVRKMAMPREMFPVASMLVSLFHVVPQLVILPIACLVYGWTPDPVGHGWRCVLALLHHHGARHRAARCCSAPPTCSSATSASVVNILTNFVRFGVPMIYPYSMVDGALRRLRASYYLLNPIADAVLLVQRAFWVGHDRRPRRDRRRPTCPTTCSRCGFVDARRLRWSCLVIAQLVFSRLENKIPERL